MNPRHLLPAFVLVTLSSCLQAEFLTSLEIGYNEQTFHPSLVGPGGTGDYKDVGRGPEVAALAGYELDLADWFSIAGIARGAYTSAEWEIHTFSRAGDLPLRDPVYAGPGRATAPRHRRAV